MPTISSAGAVTISGKSTVGATAKAIGTALNGSADTSIGAAVGLNVESIANTASVGAGSTVTGSAITVEAVTPAADENDFIVWAFAASNSKNTASVSASAGIQVLNDDTTASIGKGATVTATGSLTVHAQTKLGLLNLAISGALSSSGSAIGGAFAVNIINDVNTQAYVDSSNLNVTHVNAGGALTVKAESSLNTLQPQLPASAPSWLQNIIPHLSSAARRRLGGRRQRPGRHRLGRRRRFLLHDER